MGPIRELGPAALLAVKAEDVRALEEKVKNSFLGSAPVSLSVSL
jgi:hypothetical protein